MKCERHTWDIEDLKFCWRCDELNHPGNYKSYDEYTININGEIKNVKIDFFEYLQIDKFSVHDNTHYIESKSISFSICNFEWKKVKDSLEKINNNV